MGKINDLLDKLLYWILLIIFLLGIGILIKMLFFGGIK
jgi:hypothetical protein